MLELHIAHNRKGCTYRSLRKFMEEQLHQEYREDLSIALLPLGFLLIESNI